MKYYFISYMYGASEKEVKNRVIDEHPFLWQSYAHESYPNQYSLITWKEITKKEFELYIQTHEPF